LKTSLAENRRSGFIGGFACVEKRRGQPATQLHDQTAGIRALMRFKKQTEGIFEGDLTPMIDMTFQLIAFFMLIMNFSEVEKSAEIQLPLSAIVKPPETPPAYKIILNVEENGLIKFSSLPPAKLEAFRPVLLSEIGAASRIGVPPEKISVIIRADKSVKTGLIQDLMDACKRENMETFSLRVVERLR
jgi:biopolymer transport protein ExbD